MMANNVERAVALLWYFIKHVDYLCTPPPPHDIFAGHIIILDITLPATDKGSSAALHPHNSKDPHRGGKPLFII